MGLVELSAKHWPRLGIGGAFSQALAKTWDWWSFQPSTGQDLGLEELSVKHWPRLGIGGAFSQALAKT